MATIYKASGEVESVQPVDGKKFTLEEMQAIVGGYIQFVYLAGNMIMVMDEEGKLKEKPLNERGTEITMSVIALDDYIVGDVLVAHRNFID